MLISYHDYGHLDNIGENAVSAGSPDTSLCGPCIDLSAEACQCVGCKSDSHGGDGSCRNTRAHHIAGAGTFCAKCSRAWKCAKCGESAKAFMNADSSVRVSNLHLCASCCDVDDDVLCQPCLVDDAVILARWTSRQSRLEVDNLV